MAKGKKGDNVSGSPRIFINLDNHTCKVCKSQGNLIATGQKIGTITGIDFLAVIVKCTYCIAEFLFPILLLCTNEADAKKHWDFVCKMEEEEENSEEE